MPKHKTKILVTTGWISPYRYLVTDENTEEEKYTYNDSLFISEFEILEDGTDEEPKPKEWKKKEDTNSDGFNLSFDINDELPF